METKYLLLLIFATLTCNAADCEHDYGQDYRHYNGCLEHEVPSDCANCKETCNVRKVDENCICFPGCECEPGYLRNSEGICVPENSCDAPCNNDYGKVFDLCGLVQCQIRCYDYLNNFNSTCTKVENCEKGLSGCTCRPGLVDNDGECVRLEDCSKKCPSGEIFSECLGGLECEGTCLEPNKRRTCLQPTCRAGCTCADGYLRDENGVCIYAEDCFNSCGGDPNARVLCPGCDIINKCSEIDDDVEFPCMSIREERERGICTTCYCKVGYAELYGRCIPIVNCPVCRGENEAFICRKFDLRSENFHLKKEYFDMQSCTEGCYCKLGYARNENNECVILENILQPPCEGDPNAYYEQCFIGIDQKKVCKRNGECLCKEGFVKNSVGKCVSP